MTSIAEQIAEWVVKTSFEDIPPVVVANAQRSIIDTVGVALAGIKTELAVSAEMYARQNYASGKCNVIGSNRKMSAPGAAFVNCIAARILDYDDTCYAGRADAAVVHASGVILPAVWAAAEDWDLSGKDLLTTFVLGSEVEYLICRLLTADFFAKGWFTASTLGIIGAAVGVGKARNLDVKQLTNTIGLAISGAANTRVCLGTNSNAFSSGRAAEGGICAAEMAHRGASAPSDAFEGPEGFLKVYNDQRMDANALQDLGKVFALSAPGLWYKLFPVCTSAQAASEVTLELCAANTIEPQDVANIECVVSPLVSNLLRYRIPLTPAEAQFSLPFAVASCILFQRLTLAELNEHVLRDPRLLAIIEKTNVVTYREGGLLPYAAGEATEKATVVITMSDGRVFSATKEYASGTPEKPITDQQLKRKFLSCGQGTMGEERLHELLGELKKIDSVPKASTILSNAFR